MAKYQPVSKTKYTLQTIFNFAFDEVFKVVRFVQHIYNPITGEYQAKEDASPAVVKIDEPDSITTYIGSAAPGTATSVSSWQIKKISINGDITTIQFADGNKNYDNEYDERAALSYS